MGGMARLWELGARAGASPTAKVTSFIELVALCATMQAWRPRIEAEPMMPGGGTQRPATATSVKACMRM